MATKPSLLFRAISRSHWEETIALYHTKDMFLLFFLVQSKRFHLLYERSTNSLTKIKQTNKQTKNQESLSVPLFLNQTSVLLLKEAFFL